MLPFGHMIYIMTNHVQAQSEQRPYIEQMPKGECTSCGRLISEHILCSYDKVTRYCPGGPGPSKKEELESIKRLLGVFEKLGI